MVKIPIVSFTISRARKGDKAKRQELMQRTLSELKKAQFTDSDIHEFLIDAFTAICNGTPADKALLQKGNQTGSIVRSDTVRQLEIGQEIFDQHNTLVEGKTKGRKRKPKLNDCYEDASKKHGIGVGTAQDYYKTYKQYLKS